MLNLQNLAIFLNNIFSSDTLWLYLEYCFRDILLFVHDLANSQFQGKFWTTGFEQYLLNLMIQFFLLLLPRVQKTWRIWVIHDGRNSGAFFVHSHIKWWRLAKIWALTTKMIPLPKVIVFKSRGELFLWNNIWDLFWFWASLQYWQFLQFS